MKTVAEIAKMFSVTKAGVGYWIAQGLPYQTEKVMGVKERRVINPEDVFAHLKLSKHEEERIREQMSTEEGA